MNAPNPQAWPANRGFAPDALRAGRLDEAVRSGLAESLTAIFAALDPPRWPDDPSLAALVRAIASGPVKPGIFAIYVELVLAIFDERTDDTDMLIAALLGAGDIRASAFQVRTLDDADLGAGQAARYQRLLADDIVCPIAPLAPDAFALVNRQLAAALELLRDGAPDVFGEFAALVREVVVVRPDVLPGARTFGAASIFSLWGALVLNVEALGGRVDLAMQLAHEATHTHLFGLALGGRITENDTAERYPSPLRRDARPMEGVAHATFVTGRMIYLLDALIASGQLEAAEQAYAREQLTHFEVVQAQGLATVRQGARLAPAGQAAFDDLERFLEARRLAVVPT